VLDDLHPGVVVEARLVALDVVHRGAAGVVVELHPDKVERRVGDGVTQLSVGDGALRSTRDIKGAVRDLGVVFAEAVDHVGVTYIIRSGQVIERL
jgi:hypothetical protein